MKSSNQQLMEMISEMEPIEFIGLAKLLSVPIIKKVESDMEVTTTEQNDEVKAADPQQKHEPRAFVDVLGDVMRRFDALNRARKREILKLVKKSNRGERRAHNSKNTEGSDIN